VILATHQKARMIDGTDRPPTHPPARTISRSGWGAIAIGLVALGALTLPTVALLERTIDAQPSLADARTRETLLDALWLSLVTSVLALAVIVAFGTPAAWMLARYRLPAHRLIDALIDLPIILPPAVAGIALLAAFGRRGLLGEPLNAFGISIGFSTAAVVIAQIFVAAPFYIRTARTGFGRIEPGLEEAAADLGASPSRVFWRVVLPMTRSSLAAGAVLAWARALGEFGATIMFAGNREGVTQTMPLAIYERFQAGDLPTALLLSVVLLATSAVLLIIVRLLGEPGAPR
jgi:molybdate transport system permease protein